VLSTNSKVDRYLIAVLLGVLHANARSDGTPRGLTIAMPNTFSMAPRYVMKYKNAHGLVAPKRNVLSFLEKRIEQLGKIPTTFCRGDAWLQDATELSVRLSRFKPPRLIFTSPPYLNVMKYGKINWLRLWLLGLEPSEVDSTLFASRSLLLYLEFMSKVIVRMEASVADDGRICLVIGDVKRGDTIINLAQAVADTCVTGSTLRINALIEDELPVGQKVSRIWKDRRGNATKTDRILILSARGAGRLPRIMKPNWFTNN
jgi:site-specific DNA-methyltransferase (adenine-specific)